METSEFFLLKSFGINHPRMLIDQSDLFWLFYANFVISFKNCPRKHCIFSKNTKNVIFTHFQIHSFYGE